MDNFIMNKLNLFLFVFLLGILSLNSCKKSYAWTQYREDNNTILTRSTDMVIDQEKNIWVAYNGDTVYRYNSTDQQWVVDFSIREKGLNSVVNVLTSGFDNDLWIGAETGLGHYQYDINHWTSYTGQDGLENEDVRAILIDHDGNIWVGTGGGGVFLSRDDGNFWEHIIIEEEFSDFTVHAIYQDSRGHIWVAGDALYHFDPVLQVWSTLTDGGDRLNSLTGEWETSPPETNVLPDDFVYSIIEDGNGTLWFGTLTAGVLWYDSALDKWGQFTTADGLVNETVRAINIDTHGNLWFGTVDGASRFNPQLNEWTTFDSKNGFTNHITHSIVVDNQGRLWFATFGDGVFMFDPSK